MSTQNTPAVPVGPLARNVLPIISGTGAFLSALWAVLATFGIHPPAGFPDALVGLIGAGFGLAALIYARLRTTPLVDPVDALGNRLVPALRTGGPVTRPGSGGLLGRGDVE
jgi:hypothetical protein